MCSGHVGKVHGGGEGSPSGCPLLLCFPSCGLQPEPSAAKNSGKINGTSEPAKWKNRFCCAALVGAFRKYRWCIFSWIVPLRQRNGERGRCVDPGRSLLDESISQKALPPPPTPPFCPPRRLTPPVTMDCESIMDL